MKNFLIVLLLIAGKCLSAQHEDQFEQLKVDVVYLASDFLEGRMTGTPGEEKAASYIAYRLRSMGIEPAGEAGQYYQPFAFKLSKNPHMAATEADQNIIGKNVIGFIDNGAESTIAIGAHYDHLGMGGIGSRAVGVTAIHNGADDNASGVAAMLLLAEDLVKNPIKKFNYLFIAFSGEELGLYGSKAYVNNPTLPLEKFSCLLNMDMIGRMSEEKGLVVNGVGTSPAWKAVLNAANIGEFQLTMTESGVGPSDHTPFYLEGIPALHFFSGAHDHYHTPADDAALLNFDGIYAISKYMYNIIRGLEAYGKLAFTKTKDESTRDTPDFKVTFGIMPDYTAPVEGLRIDAIISERPAEKAGMLRGDVITKIGKHKVGDIYSYMEALANFEKGETTLVRLLRADEIIEKSITF